MSKINRQVGRAIRKLNRCKTSGAAQKMLQDLRKNKPDVYQAMQNVRGN